MFTSRTSWCSERCSTDAWHHGVQGVLSDCVVCPSLLSRNKELSADIIPVEKVSMLHRHGYGCFLPGTVSYCYSSFFFFFFWHNGKHFSVFAILKVFQYCQVVPDWAVGKQVFPCRSFSKTAVKVSPPAQNVLPFLPFLSCVACTGKQFKANWLILCSLGGWWSKIKEKKKRKTP